MKRTIASLVALLLAGPSYAIDWCAAPGVEGYWKTVEVCDHYPSTQKTECEYQGKLWGDLGGIIFREIATYSGNVSCPATLYISPLEICEGEESPTHPNFIEPWPIEPTWPTPTCDTYSGDISLFDREVVNIEGAVIPGSCHDEQVWVRCH